MGLKWRESRESPEELQELRNNYLKKLQDEAEEFYKETEKLVEKCYGTARFQPAIENFAGGTWSRANKIFSSQTWDYAEFRRLTDKELQ